MNSSDISELLLPIKNNIEALTSSLEIFSSRIEKIVADQQIQIDTLQTRIKQLEQRQCFSEHQICFNRILVDRNERKLDDVEQRSRKVNLRIDGIMVEDGETPATLLKLIQNEVAEAGVGINSYEYDHCHRVGPVYKKRGIFYQQMILRLASWSSRNMLYVNRKKFKFRFYADLTNYRSSTLNFAKDVATDYEVVDYVMVDANCKLKFRDILGKFHHFSSRVIFPAS